MKSHTSFSWQSAKKHLIVLSCASALATFTLVAGTVSAEETNANSSAITTVEMADQTTATTENSQSQAIAETATSQATAVSSEVSGSEAVISEAASEAISQVGTSETASSETASDATTTSETAATTGFYSDETGNWYYLDSNGNLLKGAQVVDGINLYFNEDGSQVKGDFAADGYYYDGNSGARVTSSYVTTGDNNWYYVDENGNKVTGSQTIDGVQVYFNADGTQVKGALPTSNNYYLLRYYDVNTGQLLTSSWVEYKNKWYYLDENGNVKKGMTTIDDQEYAFNQYWGFQIKGEFNGYFSEGYSTDWYYDGETGIKVTTEGWVQNSYGEWFYLDSTGKRLIGLQTIDGEIYYFTPSGASKNIHIGAQTKGSLMYFNNGFAYYAYSPYRTITHIYYFDSNTGAAVKNRYVQIGSDWYYFGEDGNALIGQQVINGQSVYFNANGSQVKGKLVTIDGASYYYDADSGVMATNTTRTINSVTYSFDENGIGTIITG